MVSFLAEKQREIQQKLEELRPLHDEYVRLERAFAALEGAVGEPRRGSGRPRGRGRARAGATAGTRRRGRRGGTRADQALEVVRQNPGITVSELGDRLGIAQKNYLYRVMASLQSQGAVHKQGRGFTAV